LITEESGPIERRVVGQCHGVAEKRRERCRVDARAGKPIPECRIGH